MVHLLHGGVGMAEDWRFFQKDTPFETRAVDLWSYLEGGACDLREAGRKLVAESEPGDFLVGYSMGGRLALHALLAEPDHWSGAVIVSAHPGLPAGNRGERAARVRADAEWARRAREGAWSDFLRKWNAQSVLHSSDMAAWGNRLALEKRREAVARSFEQWSLGQQDDLAPELAALDRPLRWLCGGKDRKFSRLASALAAKVRTIDLHEIGDAGHRVPWEKTAEFKTLLEDYCRDRQKKSGGPA